MLAYRGSFGQMSLLVPEPAPPPRPIALNADLLNDIPGNIQIFFDQPMDETVLPALASFVAHTPLGDNVPASYLWAAGPSNALDLFFGFPRIDEPGTIELLVDDPNLRAADDHQTVAPFVLPYIE